jgi:hypothetical protein
MMVMRRADAGGCGVGGTLFGLPRLVVINGRKNPSMTDAAHGLSELHENAGTAFVMTHSRPSAMTVKFRDRMHDLAEKIILSGKSCCG